MTTVTRSITIIRVKKSFMAQQHYPGVGQDGKWMLYEASKYYGVKFSDLRLSAWNTYSTERLFSDEYVEEVSKYVEEREEGSSRTYLRPTQIIYNLSEIKTFAQPLPAGVKLETSHQIDGSFGNCFDWFIDPQEMDHQTLVGNFKITGPFGVKGWLNASLKTVIEDVRTFADRWVRECRGRSEYIHRRTLGFHINKYSDGMLFMGTKAPKPENPGGGSITSSFQNWKTVALFKGLGFTHFREEEGDEFVSHAPVVCVFEGWEPSKDGSRLTKWDDLSNPQSPHYQRRYVEVYQFLSPDGFENYVAFSADPHIKGNLRYPIALSGWKEWDQFEHGDYDLTFWLKENAIMI